MFKKLLLGLACTAGSLYGADVATTHNTTANTTAVQEIVVGEEALLQKKVEQALAQLEKLQGNSSLLRTADSVVEGALFGVFAGALGGLVQAIILEFKAESKKTLALAYGQALDRAQHGHFKTDVDFENGKQNTDLMYSCLPILAQALQGAWSGAMLALLARTGEKPLLSKADLMGLIVLQQIIATTLGLGGDACAHLLLEKNPISTLSEANNTKTACIAVGDQAVSQLLSMLALIPQSMLISWYRDKLASERDGLELDLTSLQQKLAALSVRVEPVVNAVDAGALTA